MSDTKDAVDTQDYVGGADVVVTRDDGSREPVELGKSIFDLVGEEDDDAPAEK